VTFLRDYISIGVRILLVFARFGMVGVLKALFDEPDVIESNRCQCFPITDDNETTQIRTNFLLLLTKCFLLPFGYIQGFGKQSKLESAVP